jgi:hypothetical protein
MLDVSIGARRAYRVERTVTHRSWGAYDEGIAVASPWRLDDARIVNLPDGALPRRALVVRAVTGQGPVSFATTHLDHADGAVRAAQTAALLGALDNGGTRR